MKRFIDLRDQINDIEDTPVEFAFYDTVVDRFEMFCGTQTWDSRAQFIVDYREHCAENDLSYQLERYLDLMPEWVK